MGLGRTNMKKLFIEDIKKKGDVNSPGPGKYASKKLFGNVGRNYSMSKKLDLDKVALEKSKKLPGPGFYSYQAVTGMNLT